MVLFSGPVSSTAEEGGDLDLAGRVVLDMMLLEYWVFVLATDSHSTSVGRNSLQPSSLPVSETNFSVWGNEPLEGKVCFVHPVSQDPALSLECRRL